MEILTPSLAPLENLKLSHDVDYINKVTKDELTKDYLRLINLPWSDRLRERSFLEAEGTYLTAKTSLQTGLACHVGGGTHHAHYDHYHQYLQPRHPEHPWHRHHIITSIIKMATASPQSSP